MNREKRLDVKRLAVNMIFSVIAFVLNFGISFFITPYITSQFGAEAYGYVKLADDFTSYATILTIALNSMASRFIMLERERGNEEGANQYYTSVTIANVILAAILMIPSGIVVCFLEKMIEIPLALMLEVKLTFAITFVTFLLNLVFSTYSNCFYLSNRLDYSSVQDMIANVLRVGSILFLFVFLKPRIYYVVVGGLIAVVFRCGYNVFFTKKLTPDLKFNHRNFSKVQLKNVLSSGIWNSITRLSQVFSSGLDLLITNVLVGANYMGYLSVAKTVPNMIATLNATVANVFSPNLMLLYANDDLDALKNTVKAAMKFLCVFVSVPCAVLIVMGTEFFQLWVPGEPAELINVLSILTIINSCVTGPMQPLYQVFTITNKIKQSSIILIIYGFSCILCTYICLRLTNLGVYAVAGVSLVGSLIVALGYHLPFSAKYIGLPKTTFFPEIGKSVIALIVSCAICRTVKVFIVPDTWVSWFAAAIAAAIGSVIVNFFIILKRNERAALLNKVRGMRGRK